MNVLGARTLVFGTSAAVLILEVLAGRLVAPYIGVSLETYTGIIGTVLAGIAGGTAIGGRLADRGDPRRLLGTALVLGGVLALLSLPVITLLGPSVAGAGPLGVVALAVAGFLAPAGALSAVSPMVAKLQLSSLTETGAVVGGLSAVGTAGALVGTFLSGFVLLAAVPSRVVIIGLGSTLVVVGTVVRWRLTTRRPHTALVAVAMMAGAGAGAAPSVCQVETAYFCASVRTDPDRSSGRVLALDNLRHSYIDLDDPAHLEFRYVRLFARIVESTHRASRPVVALHIGGGGFNFPRHLAATRPGTDNTVLELDADLVRLAEQELGLTGSPGLRVKTGDARTAMAGERSEGYDVVVGDAFGGLSPPWHLTTVEFVREVDRVLRPDGTYVLNVIDGGDRRFVRAELATLAEVFNHVAVVLPPGDDGSDVLPTPENHVLVASDQPLRPLAVNPDDGVVLTGKALDVFIGRADPLTDDFAPVDRLITRR